MAVKAFVLSEALAGIGCLGRARDDEPVFVLRAQDRCAPKIVRAWAEFAKNEGVPEEKVADARRVADEMDEWQRLTGRAKWPD